jgi:hypothetical protein
MPSSLTDGTVSAYEYSGPFSVFVETEMKEKPVKAADLTGDIFFCFFLSLFVLYCISLSDFCYHKIHLTANILNNNIKLKTQSYPP